MVTVKLAGRYEVVQELTGHGLVRVFRVVDTKDNLSLLIKTMPVSDEYMEDFIRFQEEGALITTLDHPNIWKVFGTFIDEGVSCIVLEVVEGPTLGEVLRQGRAPLAWVQSIALQIAGALAYAHSRGIIHRDLEPENIVIADGNRVKLRAMAELGVARVVKGAALPVPTTTLDRRFSPYASPEQRQGRTVDARTDVYSLGALMYHMISGFPPFDNAQGTTGFTFPDDVPIEWQGLIARAMARNERYRFSTMAEMGEAIARLPTPGTSSMQFQVPVPTRRCPRCGREGKGQFCPQCGTKLPQQ